MLSDYGINVKGHTMKPRPDNWKYSDLIYVPICYNDLGKIVLPRRIYTLRKVESDKGQIFLCSQRIVTHLMRNRLNNPVSVAPRY